MKDQRLDQSIASLFSRPHRKLGGIPRSVLELGEDIVDPSMHQHATIYAHEPACLPVDKAKGASRPHREPGVIPVAVLLRRRDRVRDRNVFQTAHPGQGIHHQVALHGQLAAVGQMLPLATGAIAVVGTGRRHPVRRRLQHLHGVGGGVAPVDPHHLRHHGLTGYTAENEHVPALVLGHGFAQPPPRIQRHGDAVSGGQGNLMQLASQRAIHFYPRITIIQREW